MGGVHNATPVDPPAGESPPVAPTDPVLDPAPTGLHPKVKNAGYAGILTTVITGALEALGVKVPPEIATAITTGISLVVGYLTKP